MADQVGGDERKDLEAEIDELGKKKQEMTRENLELKEKVKRLSGEIEEMRSLETETKQRFEEMEMEMEQFEEEKKVLETISARAVDLESEVLRIQDDLIAAVSGGDETAEEVGGLKKELTEKGESFEGFEKEAERLRKGRDESEKRVRDLERKIGVLEVKEMEEKSKKVRVEEEMRERCGEKDEEIKELVKKVDDLKLESVKDVDELGILKSEKKRTEESLSELEKSETEMELKKEELLKNVEEAKEMIALLNERILKPDNGVRESNDGEQKSSLEEGQEQWPLVVAAAGSLGAIGLVVATCFVCYSKTNVIR